MKRLSRARATWKRLLKKRSVPAFSRTVTFKDPTGPVAARQVMTTFEMAYQFK
jgi:hypothetical protein